MTIDWWTLGLQTVNVVVLVWLLQRFFWRPVAAMIELRKTTAQAALAEAEATKAKAAATLAEIELTRAGIEKERNAVLSAAQDTAAQAGTKLLAEAEQAAAARECTAKLVIEKERQAEEAAWSERSSRLAIEIAGRLAARLDSAAVRDSFLGWLMKAVGDLPEAQRQVDSLEIICAKALDPAEEERVRGLINKAFSGNPIITFKSDPTLIAGLELQGPHLIIRNSWQADLEKILGDITHGS